MPIANAENNVSRAEEKLASAVRAFSYDFRGKTVLDIGSSTGGFTELALRRGAKKVVAVEIGTRQMKSPLRYDPRIDLHEKTDIFDFHTTEHFDAIVADVSFVSLKKVILYVAENLASLDTDLLFMLKPQFEARRDQLTRGVVKNEHIRREIIKDFESFLRTQHIRIEGKHDNSLAGRSGNIERFYLLHILK